MTSPSKDTTMRRSSSHGAADPAGGGSSPPVRREEFDGGYAFAGRKDLDDEGFVTVYPPLKGSDDAQPV